MVQPRRAKALVVFRIASSLHEQKRHPARRRVSDMLLSF
jgi:hypothetical protein